MAGEKRLPSPDLETSVERCDALLQSAHRSTFFSVMAQLERMTSGAVRVGGEGPSHLEAIRFLHDENLAFSAGDISSARTYERPAYEGHPARLMLELTTTFLGLSGSVTPLPLYVADELAQDTHEAGVQRAFLDVFHHRLVSLLYRAVVRYQVADEHSSDCADPWSMRLLTLLGVDAYGRAPTTRLPLDVLLRCSAMLVGRARTAHTLEVVLTEALGEVLGDGTVSLEQRTLGMSAIDESARLRLGRANHALGVSTLLGAQVLDRGDRFLLRIGPLPSSMADSFTPGGASLLLVERVVAFLSREPLSYEIELSFRGEDHPPFVLSSRTPVALGRGSWLGASSSKPRTLRVSPTGTC